jgi:hypothetical protein
MEHARRRKAKLRDGGLALFVEISEVVGEDHVLEL